MSSIPPRAATAPSTPPNPPPRAGRQDSPKRNPNTISPPDLRSKHAQAVLELVEIAKIPLISAATVQTLRMPDDKTYVSPWAMDAYTLDMHKVPLAQGIADIAKNYPVLGALLDKVSLTAPLGGLFAVALTMIAQCCENHRVPGPFSSMPGVVPRDELAHGLALMGQEFTERDRTEEMSTNGSE